MNPILIEITSFGDFDMPTTFCIVSGTPKSSLLNTNKDFITWLSKKFSSQYNRFTIHSTDDLNINVIINNEIKEISFKKDGKFILPSGLNITPLDYFNFLTSIGFKEVKTLKISTNSN